MPNNGRMVEYNNWRHQYQTRHDRGNDSSSHYEQRSRWGNYDESRRYGNPNFYNQNQHSYGGYARNNLSQSRPRAQFDSRSDSYQQGFLKIDTNIKGKH